MNKHLTALLLTLFLVLPLVALGQAVPGGTAGLAAVEDAAHASGDRGTMCLGVRDDSLTVLAGTTGDYIPLMINSSGALVTSCTLDPSLVEDAAETAGGALIMSGAVRRDTPASSSGTTGDNSTINVDVLGKLWVTGTYTEDSAETSAMQMNMCGSVRRDAAASSAGTDGDNASVNTDALGKLWVTGTYLEDVAETAAAGLAMAGTVRRDTAASSAGTTGDNATLNTDATGRLWTSGAAAEDSGHTSADQGVVMLGVQQTTLTGLAGTTLDYAPMQFNAQGSLYSAPTGNAALVVERIDVASTGTSVQGSAAAVKTCFVSCPGTNTSACYIRASTGNGVTGGFAIAKGTTEGPWHVQNTNLFWVDAGTNGDDVVLLCTN